MSARLSALVVTLAALAAAVTLTLTGNDATPAWALLAAAGGLSAGIPIPSEPTPKP